jgi:DNA (cytosine-5)-methyltransferase 1
MQLVLSLFPGIGLLDMAFEEEGFCVVRGPDLLWGGDVRRFHPPAGRFDGVIGGPPCQAFSKLGVMARNRGQNVGENMIPEFERCVREARPTWFVMENVPEAPTPTVDGYEIDAHLVENRTHAGGEQRRKRRFSFGTRDGLPLPLPWWKAAVPKECIPTVTANGSFWDPVKQQSRGDKTIKTLRLTARAQGLSEEVLEHAPFTVAGKIKVLGNGVPLPMGRAVAHAVRRALRMDEPAAGPSAATDKEG